VDATVAVVLPAVTVFKGGATTLALDPGAASALQQLGITPGVAVTRPPAPAAWPSRSPAAR
jgi:hypothetical protein